MRPHQNDRRFLRLILAHGGVDLVLDNVLQIKIDSQPDVVAVAGRALLPAIKHDLLAGPITLGVTIAVLAVQIFFHRRLDALNSSMIEIGESDHVTKHRAVGIKTGRVALEIDAAQILGAQFVAQRLGNRVRYFALDHDITPVALEFFSQFAGRDL